MDHVILASLSHTHYWYEVGMLKVPASYTLSVVSSLIILHPFETQTNHKKAPVSWNCYFWTCFRTKRYKLLPHENVEQLSINRYSTSPKGLRHGGESEAFWFDNVCLTVPVRSREKGSIVSQLHQAAYLSHPGGIWCLLNVYFYFFFRFWRRCSPHTVNCHRASPNPVLVVGKAK